MYLLSFLIFSVLVVNTIAAEADLTNGTESEYQKNLIKAATPLCECSKYPLNAEPKCKSEDQQAFDVISKNDTTLIDAIDGVCKNIKAPKGMDSATSSTEHYETTEHNNTEVQTGTQGLKGIVSKTSSTEHYQTETPTEVETGTHGAVSSINYLGCKCVSNKISTPESTTISLDCTISQKVIDLYQPPPATVEMFEAFCQKLTWESLPPPPPNDESISTFMCTKDEKHCLKADPVLDSMKTLCACSNESMGALTTPCEDEDKKVWLSLNETIRGKIDKLCGFVGNLSTELRKVIPENITTEKKVTISETTTESYRIESTSGTSQSDSTDPNVITTSASIAGSAKPYISDPKVSQDPAPTYSLKMVLLIGFAAFACGTLAAIAAKMSYTRYKRRAYVNQVRA